MAGKAKDRWPGGYIHRQADGRLLFVLERRVKKHRFHISTRCHNLTSAMKQLERFEADPFGYSPAGEQKAEALRMTADLIDEFETWSVDVRGNTQKHANEMSNRLLDWIVDLNNADLRGVTLREHIKPALERRKTSRQHRIIAIKSFYAWLRKERHLLDHAEDPTLDLVVPTAVPEKRRRRKAVERERIAAVFNQLEPVHRDCLLLLVATGWHVTELERFIRQDASEIVVQPEGADSLATLVTRHKGGETTRTPIGFPEHLEAAQRLRAGRVVPRRLNDAIKEACRKAEVAEFTLGVMRHSVATWAVQSGARPSEVSEFLQHKDPSTTRNFYIDVSAPTVRVPVMRLVKAG